MANERTVNNSINTSFPDIKTEVKIKSIARKLLSIPALIAIDLAAVIGSLLAAFYLRSSIFQSLFPSFFPEELLESTFSNIWWFPLVVIFCLLYENLYQKRLPFWTEVEILLKAVTLSVFLTIVWLYLAQVDQEISRTLIILTWFSLIILLPLFRYYGKILLSFLTLWKKPVLIVGSGSAAMLIARALQREKTIGYEVIGLLEHKNNLAGPSSFKQSPAIPLIGTTDHAEDIISKTGVEDIIIAVSGLPTRKLVKMTNRLQRMTSNVLLMPDLFGLALSGIELQYFFQEQTLLLQIKNRLKSTFNRAIKQTMDLLLGAILFLLSLPLLALLALAVKLDSKGPVFYVDSRLGQGRKLFNCYKFRTMSCNAGEILTTHLEVNPEAKEMWQNYQKLGPDDPRVTRVGAFLRRFSLDELPQLINVVKGEMSLVGPRPYLPREEGLMGEWLNDIIVAKPGLTGLWQVSGRNNISFEGRLKLDSWYMKNWSPWLDILLILRTFKVVIKADGAY